MTGSAPKAGLSRVTRRLDSGEAGKSCSRSSARETADLLSKRIVLIDGTQLAALMVQQNIGCRVEDTLHIKKLDGEFFEA